MGEKAFGSQQVCPCNIDRFSVALTITQAEQPYSGKTHHRYCAG